MKEAWTWRESLSATAILISVVALWISSRRSREANALNASNAWTTVLMRFLEEEVLRAWDDGNLTRTFYNAPHETPATKQAARTALLELRDKGDRCLHSIAAFAGSAAALQTRKNERDAVSESFWENGETFLSTNAAAAVLARYSIANDAYLAALRDFLKNLSNADSRAGVLKPPKAPFWHKWTKR